MNTIAANVDVTKINKAWLFKGKSGTYLDLTLRENKDGPGKYGDDGFIVQGPPKAEREQGVKGIIVGNWKFIGERPKASQPQSKILPTEADKPATPEDDVPF